MTRSKLIVLAVVAALAVTASACSRSDAAPSTRMKIAFVADMSIDDPGELISPALVGLQTRLAESGLAPGAVQVVQLDVGTTSASAVAIADRIAGDRSYIAAVIGPFWLEPAAFAQALAGGGVPVIDLSPYGEPAGVWRGLVAKGSEQAATLAAILNRDANSGGLCLGTEPAPYSDALASAVREGLREPAESEFRLGRDGSLTEAVTAVGEAGCGTVGWIGFPTSGTKLRDALDAAGLSGVRLVAGDPMKTLSYIQESSHDGTFVTCPCADVNTSSDVAAEQLVHDYQIVSGREPGAYTAEAWDAAGMLSGAMRTGSSTRALMGQALANTTSFDGVARRYTFGADGWPLGAAVGICRAQSARWLPVVG